MISFTVPIDPRGGLNAREHWAARAKRVKAERLAVAVCAPLPWEWKALRAEGEAFRVVLTRVAPRKCDDDGWVGRAKSVRDEVARLLGIDDGDERVRWEYHQTKGEPKQHAVRVNVWAMPVESTRSTRSTGAP